MWLYIYMHIYSYTFIYIVSYIHIYVIYMYIYMYSCMHRFPLPVAKVLALLGDICTVATRVLACAAPAPSGTARLCRCRNCAL